MRQEVKDAWVQALESDDYEQGRGALRTVEGDKFCCLGVLCDLAVKDGVAEWVPANFSGDISRVKQVNGSQASGSYLPRFVLEWAGVEDADTSNGDFNVVTSAYSGDGEEEINLASLNDQGHPFHAIAKLIREQL